MVKNGHSSTSMYCTECKAKNNKKKRERPGNEATTLW